MTLADWLFATFTGLAGWGFCCFMWIVFREIQRRDSLKCRRCHHLSAQADLKAGNGLCLCCRAELRRQFKRIPDPPIERGDLF